MTIKKVIKRNWSEVAYDSEKIRVAIQKANHEVPEKEQASEFLISEIIRSLEAHKKWIVPIEEIQDYIEKQLIEMHKAELAKKYIIYRYQRALVERQVLPDLIIVDGGENQIRAAQEIINMLHANIKVVGLKKNDKHRTNDLIDSDLSVITLDRMSNVFHYLTRMQDEVHRFTINYHRQIRSKGSISSVLDDIEGIGTSRKKALIKKFGSISKMRNASIEELSEILPEKVAGELKKYLEEKENSKNDSDML